MGYPNGVSLAVVSGGTAFTAFGDDVPVQITVTPRFPKQGGGFLTRIIHAATGWVMTSDPDTFTADAGTEVSFSVPHVDQAGFRDPAQNAYTGWYYEVKVVVGAARGRTKTAYTQTVSPVVGQALVDLDLVPEGQNGNPQSVAVPEVVSVNGQTGAVVVETGANDADIANLLQTPSSATGAALDTQTAALMGDTSTTTGGALESFVDTKANATRASLIDPLTTALDTRDPRPLVVAQASDSTGDSADEWFEISWRELLAEKWPDRPARLKRWIKATDVYSDLITWQTAASSGGEETQVLARDTFTTDRASLNSTADEAGHTWAVTGTSTGVVTAGHLTQPAAGSTIAAITLTNHDGIDGTLAYSYKITATAANQQTQIAYTSSSVNGGNRLQVVIAGTTTVTPKLQQVIGGVTTELATWPTDFLTYSGTEQTVDLTMSVDGTSVTATINGTTRTATIDPSVFGKTYTYFTMANAQGMRVDSFERTGVLASAPVASTLGWLTAYNGAYAGGTAATNLARIDAMYPERPDVLFLNHGHNYISTTTPELFETAVMEFVDAFHAKYPGVPVVAISQNPEFEGTGRIASQVAQHHARQRHLREMCRRRGWGYIPSFEAFMAKPDGGVSLIQSDGIHPTLGAQSGTGARLQADVAKSWIGSQSLRP